jgi:DNA-binding phage protein
MYERFTIEEVNLMCIFDMSSRSALTAELSAALPEFDEPELIEIAESALARLRGMTDAEFDALEFYPEYDDYEESEE